MPGFLAPSDRTGRAVDRQARALEIRGSPAGERRDRPSQHGDDLGHQLRVAHAAARPAREQLPCDGRPARVVRDAVLVAAAEAGRCARHHEGADRRAAVAHHHREVRHVGAQPAHVARGRQDVGADEQHSAAVGAHRIGLAGRRFHRMAEPSECRPQGRSDVGRRVEQWRRRGSGRRATRQERGPDGVEQGGELVLADSRTGGDRGEPGRLHPGDQSSEHDLGWG